MVLRQKLVSGCIACAAGVQAARRHLGEVAARRRTWARSPRRAHPDPRAGGRGDGPRAAGAGKGYQHQAARTASQRFSAAGYDGPRNAAHDGLIDRL